MEEQYGCHAELFKELGAGCTSRRKDHIVRWLLAKYDQKIRKTASNYRSLEFSMALTCCKTGFYHAILKYDHTIGTHFLHFATGYMRSECQKEYRNNRTIHIPHNLLVMIEKLNRTNAFQRPYEDLAEWERKGMEDVKDGHEMLNTASIDVPSNPDNTEGGCIGDNVPQSTFLSADEAIRIKELTQAVHSYVIDLDEQERNTMIHLYGLGRHEEKSMREVAKIIGRSHQTVLNSREKALKQLKNAFISNQADLVDGFGVRDCL